jgi:hypothetical protein
MHGSEAWTITAAEQKRLEAMETGMCTVTHDDNSARASSSIVQPTPSEGLTQCKTTVMIPND